MWACIEVRIQWRTDRSCYSICWLVVEELKLSCDNMGMQQIILVPRYSKSILRVQGLGLRG